MKRRPASRESDPESSCLAFRFAALAANAIELSTFAATQTSLGCRSTKDFRLLA
jgi:hypothetical protein